MIEKNNEFIKTTELVNSSMAYLTCFEFKCNKLIIRE